MENQVDCYRETDTRSYKITLGDGVKAGKRGVGSEVKKYKMVWYRKLSEQGRVEYMRGESRGRNGRKWRRA